MLQPPPGMNYNQNQRWLMNNGQQDQVGAGFSGSQLAGIQQRAGQLGAGQQMANDARMENPNAWARQPGGTMYNQWEAARQDNPNAWARQPGGAIAGQYQGNQWARRNPNSPAYSGQPMGSVTAGGFQAADPTKGASIASAQTMGGQSDMSQGMPQGNANPMQMNPTGQNMSPFQGGLGNFMGQNNLGGQTGMAGNPMGQMFNGGNPANGMYGGGYGSGYGQGYDGVMGAQMKPQMGGQNYGGYGIGGNQMGQQYPGMFQGNLAKSF